jgi:DNA mismatch repair protein MSH6
MHCTFEPVFTIAHRYRVARIEQTETPNMMKEANSKVPGTKRKVVLRELCSIMSKGTRTYCALDDSSVLEDDPNDASLVLVCITEEKLRSDSLSTGSGLQPVVEYGVCIVNCPLANITIGLFADDEQRSR